MKRTYPRIPRVIFTATLCALFCVSISPHPAQAENPPIRIIEIQTSGDSSRDDIFVLQNFSEDTIALDGWSLRRCISDTGKNCSTKSGTTSIVTTELKKVILSPSDTYEWRNTSTSGKLSDNYSVALFDADDAIITSLTWGLPAFTFLETEHLPNPTSCERISWQETSGVYEITQQERDACLPIIYNGEIIQLSEVLPVPAEEEEEFIELYNPTDSDINLNGWSLRDSSSSGVYQFDENDVISSQQYHTIDETNFSFALNNTGTESVTLFSPTGITVDSLTYSNAINGFSYARMQDDTFEWTPLVTKNQKNDSLRDKSYETILISEILPHPDGGEEFIELYNPTTQDLTLEYWTLSDSSDDPFLFGHNHTIKAGEYLVLKKSLYDFSLNNSGSETVTLTKPNGKPSSTTDFENPPKNASYAWDGKKFRWTKELTPGKKNAHGKELKIKDVEISKSYKGVYTTFNVETNYKDRDISVVWDFGNGRKSYKKETRHRYEEKDTFDGFITVRNDVDEVTENFAVHVRSFPDADIKIVALMPNPKGTDGDKEFIRITNLSDKKAELRDWSVATGKDLNSLVNHPFIKNPTISLPPGGSLDITKPLAAISLNNTTGAIELKKPDGSVASSVRYDYFRDGASRTIPENAVYSLTGNSWSWVTEEVDISPPTDPIRERAVKASQNIAPRENVDHIKTHHKKEPYHRIFLQLLDTFTSKILLLFEKI